MEREGLDTRDQAVTPGSQVDFSLYMDFSPMIELDRVNVEVNDHPDTRPIPLSASRSTVPTSSQLDTLPSGLRSDHDEANIINSTIVRMNLPPRQRRKKARTIRASDWEPHRNKILELHITQKLPLEKVRQVMKDEFNFTAEIRQYRSRITQWKQDKNIKTAEMKAIVKKRQKRKLVEVNKRPLVFEVRGNEVNQQKIERWMKRYNVPDSLLYAPSPGAPTPSDVACYTISERGSPAPVSVASPAASEDSIHSTAMAIYRPQAPSPTPSILSLVSFRPSEFAGQSPTLSPQALPVSSSQSLIFPEMSSHSRSVRRYLQHVEEMLRNRLYKAEMSPYYDHVEVLQHLQSLAFVFLEQGRYRKAEDIARRTLEGCRNSFGESSVIMLDAISLLGLVQNNQGQYSEAERLFQRAHKGYQAQLGQNNPKTFHCAKFLGFALSCCGKHNMAERLMRSALILAEKLYGPSHVDTVDIITGLGTILLKRRHFKMAESLLRQGWERWTRLLETGSPELAAIAYVLAQSLFKRNDLIEGELMTRYALNSNQRLLGPEHPVTVQCAHRLGQFLVAKNQLSEAEELFRSIQSALAKVLGPEHPATLISVGSLGYVFTRQGKYAEAEAIFRSCLDAYTRTLGADHPGTTIAASNLGRVYLDQGKLADAEQLLIPAFQEHLKVFGFVHSDTLVSARNLAELYQKQGHYGPALDLFQRTYLGNIEVWGAEHDSTKWCLNLYADCQAEAASLDTPFMALFSGLNK